MINIVDKAIEFAIGKHHDQMYGDVDFIFHPAEVARVIQQITDDYNLVAAAYLHDTLEDTDTTYEELVKEFGEDIASLVREVTKSGENTFPFLKTQRGVVLKFADRLANLANMHGWSLKKRQKYIEKSKFWK